MIAHSMDLLLEKRTMSSTFNQKTKPNVLLVSLMYYSRNEQDSPDICLNQYIFHHNPPLLCTLQFKHVT